MYYFEVWYCIKINKDCVEGTWFHVFCAFITSEF